MPKNLVDQALINHIFLAMDSSFSMRTLHDTPVKVADSQIEYLAKRSTELDQETRATVYSFNDTIKCHFYDKDVLRLPSISKVYKPDGNTALIDAVLLAIHDLKQTATIYGDHAFLGFVFTDGEENASAAGASKLEKELFNLPENWTIAALVPDERARHHAERVGFSPNNISVWEVSASGLVEAGSRMQRATETFFQNRAAGIRGSKNLFQASTVNLDLNKLQEISPSLYKIFGVGPHYHDQQIRDFVESCSGHTYVQGCAYYQLTKPEDVQARKLVVVLDQKTKKLYGGAHARAMVGIPEGGQVRVAPEKHTDKLIFIQSTSVNRKVKSGTSVVWFKS